MDTGLRRYFRPPWIVAVLLGVLPLCFCIQFKLKSVPAGLAFLTGLAMLVASRHTRGSFGATRIIWIAFLARMITNLINAYVFHASWSDVDLTAQILAFIVIAAVFTVPMDENLFWRLVNLGAIVLGGASLYQRFVLGIDRPYGLNGQDWGAIEYAMILFTLALFGIIQLLRGKAHPRWDKALYLVGIATSSLGALLTQSRGPLVAFICTLVVILILHTRKRKGWSKTSIAAVLVIAAMGISAVLLDRSILSRFEEAHTELQSYTPESASGAVRERLEMWRVAWQAFVEHPWMGVGINRFGDYSQQLIAQGNANASIAQYMHPHSEYLESMATGGIPGIVTLLLLMFVPLWFFVGASLDKRDEVWPLALSGIAVTANFALCALTDNVFYRTMPQSFYLFFVLGLSLWIASRRTLANSGIAHGTP